MNQSPRILIVDDEPNVRFILESTLKHEGYTLDTAKSGSEALHLLATHPYDLLLLDLHMEPISGLQVLQSLREDSQDVIVIILTAYSSVESAVEALRLGAFDYLFKPATPEEIRDRVQAGLRQYQQMQYRQRLLTKIEDLRDTLNQLDPGESLDASLMTSPRFIHAGDLTIDRHHRQMTMGDQRLDLTTAEFDILLTLVNAAPDPLSPRQLVNLALGYDSEEQEAKDIIKWHIHQLRRKIEPDPTTPRYIKTVRHKGYLWRSE